MTCKAIQMSDQMVCEQCNLTWDVNDQLPPDCSPTLTGMLREKRHDLLKPDATFITAIDGERLIGFDIAYRTVIEYFKGRP